MPPFLWAGMRPAPGVRDALRAAADRQAVAPAFLTYTQVRHCC